MSRSNPNRVGLSGPVTDAPQANDEKLLVKAREYGNCGECLWNHVYVVKLGTDGVCPKCGTDYSKPAVSP
jgi:hypothetical protein